MTPVPYPRIEPLGGNRYRLFADYVYEWTKDGTPYKLIVPTGFTCDLASIPRLLWILISPFDLGASAVPHDWFYAHAGRIPEGSWLRFEDGVWVEDTRPWTREHVDRLFGRMMREAKVPPFKRRSAYLAVRLFGYLVWVRRERKKRQDQTQVAGTV